MGPASHNHRRLVDGIRCRLEDAGYEVVKEWALPNGWRPDLVVSRGSRSFLIEVKRWHGEAKNGIAQLQRYGNFYPEATRVLAIPRDLGSDNAQRLCDEAGVSLWLFNDESSYKREQLFWRKTDYAPGFVKRRRQLERIKAAA